jgi:predicted acylesterase/phospholipase RssA
MAIVRPNDVRHLVFGGGGGRGWAHIGAVQAMEKLTNAPVVAKRKGASAHIDGVAGASIGALVAMGVALGATAAQIARYARLNLNASGFRRGDPATSMLLEDAALGRGDILGDPVVVDGRFTTARVDPQLLTKLSERYLLESLEEVLGVERSALGLMLVEWAMRDERPSAAVDEVRQLLDRRFMADKSLRQFHLFTNDSQRFRLYLANLLGRGGLLPGYAMRDFVERAARTFARAGGMTTGSDGSFTFRDLFVERGVELAVTGTHLATRRGRLFSYRDTPDFGIVPAVCISMAFPFIFKPISVSQRNERVMPDFYTGRWSDGGMINNLPLRAFPRRGSRALDPRTVAFALDEPIDRSSGMTVKSDTARVLREYLGVYLDQAVNSRFELETDEAQVVRLRTPGLRTLDMTWDDETVPAAISAAAATTRAYFVGHDQTHRKPDRAQCFKICTDWASRRMTRKDAVDGQLFEAIARAQFRSYFRVVTPAPVFVIPYIDRHRIRSKRSFSIDIIAGMAADPHTWLLIEAKGSATAPLSDPQRELHGLVEKHGGVLLNRREYMDDEEWAPFRDQSELPARRVTVVMPSNLCDEFMRLAREAPPP